MLQVWDKIHVQSLPTTLEASLHVAFTIRNYLGMDYTAPQHLATPHIDPLRFQNLDKLVTRKKWLPTVLRLESKLHTGFPSDHYLLQTDIRVKLGAKKYPPSKAPKFDYTASPGTKQHFNSVFRQHMGLQTPAPVSDASRNIKVYTDGSGSAGRCTSSTPAGWGFVVVEDDSPIHQARGPVVTDPRCLYYLGATVGSNNTGELTAWLESALFLLQATPHKSITFVYDSQWVQGMVTGKYRPKRHKSLVYLAKKVYQHLQARSAIHWQWVKGHTGEEYNELADVLAGKGKSDGQWVGGRSSQQAPFTPTTLPANQPTAATNSLDAHNAKLVHAIPSRTIHFPSPQVCSESRMDHTAISGGIA